MSEFNVVILVTGVFESLWQFAASLCHEICLFSASEVTTLWRYTNLFIIIIIIIIVFGRQHHHTLLVSLTSASEKLPHLTACWSSDMNISGLWHLA